MPSKTTNKFIFLDRDGTINKDTGHTHKIEDLEFLPGAIEGLKKFRDAGYKFIVVTNQAGLAKNIFNSDDLEKFQSAMISQLESHDIKIEKIYHCSHHPDVNGHCECRKPNIGMVQLASKEFKLNPKDCIYIGDKDSDIELGQNCRGITVKIENDQYPDKSSPNFKAKNLDHAFELLKSSHSI